MDSGKAVIFLIKSGGPNWHTHLALCPPPPYTCLDSTAILPPSNEIHMRDGHPGNQEKQPMCLWTLFYEKKNSLFVCTAFGGFYFRDLKTIMANIHAVFRITNISKLENYWIIT